MDVANNTWTLVGNGADESLVIQNVGTSRIAYVYAASKPADSAINMDTDEHFILDAGSPAVTITGLDTFSKNIYARALGPITGQLAVEANTSSP